MRNYPVPLPIKQSRCLGDKCSNTSKCARWSFHDWQTFGAPTPQVARYCKDQDTPTPITLEKA